MMIRCTAVLVQLLAACRGATDRARALSPGNQGGSASPGADASLIGPFKRIEDAEHLQSGDEPMQVTALGAAKGPVHVSLVEVRNSAAAASCMVALDTAAGMYLGEDFLCSADRSDERVFTDAVQIAIEGTTATVRFRTSYQLEDTKPDVRTYTVTCALGGVLSCTPPPAIGGYDSSFNDARTAPSPR